MLQSFRKILGLGTKVDAEKASSVFKKRYAIFKELLECNSSLATIIANMEAELRGDRTEEISQIRKDARQAVVECERMVQCLNDLSKNRQGELARMVETIGRRIEKELEQQELGDVPDLTLSLDDVDASLSYAVGGKSANLGEIRNALDVPIPDGFAITIQASLLHLLRTSGLFKKIHATLKKVDPDEPESIKKASAAVRALICEAPVPAEVEDALYKRWDDTFRDRDVVCALRSSAIAEDGVQSFAGQYSSILGVTRETLLDSFKQIVASLFSERALTYRSNHGFRLEASGMGMCCLAMVRAKAAGVAYSRHPLNLRSNCMLINGVWGLGEMVVDGSGTPDMWLYSRLHHSIEERKIACKKEQIVLETMDGKIGQKRIPVEPDRQQVPCLTDEKLDELAALALNLERHYQYPQDVEWAVDENDRLLILQTRPLHIDTSLSDVDFPNVEPCKMPVFSNADTAARGVACGAVVKFDPEAGKTEFPEGGIMLLKHSSPLAMVALRRAGAILAETGSMTGHMAILCREFNVPCLMNMPEVCDKLAEGEIVTVDAIGGRVFRGEIPELMALSIKKEKPKLDTPALLLLRRIAPFILPLHLVDPNSELFSAENCTSIHDVMRFAHEFSYSAMFQISDDLASGSGNEAAVKLVCPIPLDLYVIDLGGGIGSHGKTVSPEDIESLPMKRLLDGMLDPAVQARGPRPVNMRGFLSVMGQSMIGANNQAGERFGDHSYAIISDRYLLFSSRVGYHYAVLDTWCGETLNKNYIRFEFAGGAASNERRERRIRCIGIILTEIGFTVETAGTRLRARFQKYPRETTADRLVQMGRLLIMTRQLDMLMVNEASVQQFASNFLQGNYH